MYLHRWHLTGVLERLFHTGHEWLKRLKVSLKIWSGEERQSLPLAVPSNTTSEKTLFSTPSSNIYVLLNKDFFKSFDIHLVPGQQQHPDII